MPEVLKPEPLKILNNPPQEPQWREDFPVRWENDHYVTRRELAKFLTLGSAFLVVANVVMAFFGKFRGAERYPRSLVANASAIPESGSMLFRYPTDRDPCILVRAKTGELRAYSQTCTHLSCAVVHRAQDGVLSCPCHMGLFSESEGRPVAGPPIRPLPRILLEQQGDQVYAVGVEV